MTQCLTKLEPAYVEAVLARISKVRGETLPSAWARKIKCSPNLVLCALEEKQVEAILLLVHHLSRNGIMSADITLVGYDFVPAGQPYHLISPGGRF